MILNQLSLKNFRNYLQKDFSFTHPVCMILGENGVGKTNMLEAISLLEKPKGLRGSDLEDLQHFDTSGHWFIKNEFENRDIHIVFENGKKKVYSLDKPIAHTKIHEFLKIIWLGPQNDRIFSNAPEYRRKFFDTILSIFEPEYKVLQGKYMHYIFERTKLLFISEDPKWLSIVEQKIYEYGMLWRAKRQEALDKLNHFVKHMHHLKPVEVYAKEGEFSLALIQHARERDTKTGGCSVGPHKTDYDGTYGEKRLSLASNGEQCLGQISLFLAIIFYITQTKKVIFLMDEVFSHLDSQNQKLLIQEFQKLSPDHFQVIITLPKLLQNFTNVQCITI